MIWSDKGWKTANEIGFDFDAIELEVEPPFWAGFFTETVNGHAQKRGYVSGANPRLAASSSESGANA